MSATPKVNDNLSYQENMLGSSTLCKLTLTFTCPLWHGLIKEKEQRPLKLPCFDLY